MKTTSVRIYSEETGYDVTIEVKEISYLEQHEIDLDSQRMLKDYLKNKEIPNNEIVSYASLFRDAYALCQAAKVSFVNNNEELEPLKDPQDIEEFLALPASVVNKWKETAIRKNPFWSDTLASIATKVIQAAKQGKMNSTES